jgi:hypothetical protein
MGQVIELLVETPAVKKKKKERKKRKREKVQIIQM